MKAHAGVGLLLLLGLGWAACGDDEESSATSTTSTTSTGGGDGGGGAGGSMCPNQPSCPLGQAPFDEDGDGCGDKCCFTMCDADQELRDDNMDGCNERCGDAPCQSEGDCMVTMCFILQDTCDAPIGVCSDNACIGVPGGCGCDGNMYGTACEAAEAGVGLDTTGAACK